MREPESGWNCPKDRGRGRFDILLVVENDEGHAIATVSAEEPAAMRESRARLLGEPPRLTQNR